MASPTFEPNPAEVAADLRAARRRVQDLERERDQLQRQVAELRPALEQSQRDASRLAGERDEALEVATLANAATTAHQEVMASMLPERIQLGELVDAIARWKPGRILALEIGPWLRLLGPKDLPPGPLRGSVLRAAEAFGRLGRIPLLVLIHEGTKAQAAVLSFAPGSPDEIRDQLEQIMPGTMKSLAAGGEFTTKRHKVAFSMIASVTSVDGDAVQCAADDGGISISLGRRCFPDQAVAPGMAFTMTVIVEPHKPEDVDGKEPPGGTSTQR